MLLLAYLVLVVGRAFAAAISRLRSHSATADIWKYWLLLGLAYSAHRMSLVSPFADRQFEPRFMISCVPPLVLLVADAATQIRSKVLFACHTDGSARTIAEWHRFLFAGRAENEHTDDWRDATRYVLSQAEAGDAVLFSYSEERTAFDEYQMRFT